MQPGQITPRLVEARLQEALDDSPVVLIHGPRQSGKTTLAQHVGSRRGYAYFNLDDDVTRAAAEVDPIGFVADLHHFRDKDGYEVDLVIERGGRKLAGVEVKAAATVTEADFRGLRKLSSAAGSRWAAGVVLYDGETSASFGSDLYALPISALWES